MAALPATAFAMPITCMCVAYLSRVLDVNIHGDADTIQPDLPIQYVEVGDVVLFRYPKTAHVALVTSIASYKGGAKLQIAESNYRSCKPGVREISPSDPAIIGIYRPDMHNV